LEDSEEETFTLLQDVARAIQKQ
jgi:hypothetical protein